MILHIKFYNIHCNDTLQYQVGIAVNASNEAVEQGNQATQLQVNCSLIVGTQTVEDVMMLRDVVTSWSW